MWSASSADGMHLEAWQMQLSGYFSLIFLDSFSLLLPGIYGILPCIFSSSCQAPCILFILLLLGEYLLLQHWSLMLHQFCSVMKLLSLLRGYFFLLPHSFALVLCWTEHTRWFVARAIRLCGSYEVWGSFHSYEWFFWSPEQAFFQIEWKMDMGYSFFICTLLQVFWAGQGIF